MNNKKKLSESEIKLILLLLALLLLVGAYFLIYRKSVAAAVELEGQNDIDRETVAMLEDMERRRPQVEAETEECYQTIRDIIAKYPADMTTEKAIIIAQNIEDYSETHFTTIGFLMNNLVLDFTQTSEEVPMTPTGYYSALTMDYVVNYEGFKRILTYVGGLKDRMTVPAVSASYDPTTDMISGSLSIYMYYLQNTGKEYEAPVIHGIDKGVDSIFGAGDGFLPEFNAGGENGSEDDEAEDESAN